MHGPARLKLPFQQAWRPKIFQPRVSAVLLATIDSIEVPDSLRLELPIVREEQLRRAAGGRDAVAALALGLGFELAVPLIAEFVNGTQRHQRAKLKLHCFESRGCAEQRVG